MKKPPQAAKEEPSDSSPILFEDNRLSRGYSVLEIATLAAGCRGDTVPDRIRDAVSLLMQVETYARLGKEITTEVMARKGDGSREDSGNKSVRPDLTQRQSLDILSDIRCRVLRDAATGKIKRTSLVGLCCEKMGVCNADSPHASRLYSQWLKREAFIVGKDIEQTKARYESGSKPAVFHSDHKAGMFTFSFLGWLDSRPKKLPAAIIQSQKEETKGQIVSPKTKGAGRADDGKYGR